ncbi:hypothetical protein AAHH67_15460 [Niallia circulans]
MNNKQTLVFNQYEVTELSTNEWNRDITKHMVAYKQLKDAEVITEDQLNSLIDSGCYFWIKVVNNNPFFNKDCYLIELTLMYTNKAISLYINKEALNKHDETVTEEVVITEDIQEEANTIETTEEVYYTVANVSFTTLEEAQVYCDGSDFEYAMIQEIKEINYTVNIDSEIEQPKQEESTYWYQYSLRGFSPFCQPKGHVKLDDSVGRYGAIAYNRQLTSNELEEYELLAI